jgi:DNA-binding YbaB/EbfC family protein
MFDGLKNLAGLAGLAKNAGAMQGRMAELKDRIGRMEIEATAGGDAVRVRMSGDFRVLGVDYHDWLIQSGDRNLMQQMTTEAVNNAIQQCRDLAAAELAKLADELDIPGLKDLPGLTGQM